MTQKVKAPISWSEYEHYSELLAQFVDQSEEEYKCIYGIPRGGLPLATIMSHYLDIPITNTIESSSLIVDDICDSGHTIKRMLREIPLKNGESPDVATIFLRSSSIYLPKYYIKELDDTYWIDFPYEYPEKPDTVSNVINS